MHQGNSSLMNNIQMACIYPSKGHTFLSSEIIKSHQNYFTIMLLMLVYKHLKEIFNTVSSQLQYTHINMNIPDYWPMAREYSIWNAAVAALNFWTADLEAHTLSSTTEEVYRTFFYMPSAYTLHQISDEILFGCFVTMLNAFEQKLALEDEGYESGSENCNILTQLRRTSKIHHISSIENTSFDPVPVTPHSTRQPCLRPVCRRLMYSPSDDDDTSEDDISSPHSTPQVQYPTPDTRSSTSKHTPATFEHLEDEADEEEDFQTVLLDDEHWTTEEIPDRPLCIHEHSLPHGLCPYLCPYVDYQTPPYFKTMD